MRRLLARLVVLGMIGGSVLWITPSSVEAKPKKAQKNKSSESDATPAAAAMPAPAAAPAVAMLALTAEGTEDCKSACQARKNQSCPKDPSLDSCVSTCQQMTKKVPASCKKEWDQWIKVEGTTSWECNAQGYSKHTGAHYGYDTSFYTQCYEKPSEGQMSSPVPNPGAPCGASSGGPYCDACVVTTCRGESLACGSNSECMAIQKCILTCPAVASEQAKNTCVNNCHVAHKAGEQAYNDLRNCTVKDGQGCGNQCGQNGMNAMPFAVPGDGPYSGDVTAFTHCSLVFP